MLRDVYREPYDRAATEVDEIVDRDHLQVQDQFFGAPDGACQNQSGTDIAGLL